MQEFLPRVIAAEDIDDYYDVLSEFAALLKDGHTGVNRPGGSFWISVSIRAVMNTYSHVTVNDLMGPW